MQFRYIGNPANGARQYVKVNYFFPLSYKSLWHNILFKTFVLGKANPLKTACIYDSVSPPNTIKDQISAIRGKAFHIMRQAFQKPDSPSFPRLLHNSYYRLHLRVGLSKTLMRMRWFGICIAVVCHMETLVFSMTVQLS